MDVRFDLLLAAFARSAEPAPAELISSLGRLPEPSAMPSPWETWPLVGLFRHRKRQLGVADIIRNRLHGILIDSLPP
jgi:hypothetical protein